MRAREGREVGPVRYWSFVAEVGWEPLCAFWGVEVPRGVQCSRVNDQRTMRMINGSLLRGVCFIVLGSAF